MTAKYDFYKNPSSEEDNKEIRYHARIVGGETLSTEQLAKIIHTRCSLTTSDVHAALTALAEVIVEELKNGNQIHLNKIGYLKATVACPEIQSSHEIRAESLRFKSVAFRPEAALKQALKTMTFERIQQKRHSSEWTHDEIEALLTEHFAKQETLTSRDFQRMCQYTRSTANRHLLRLKQAGKLLNVGFKKAAIYTPAPGCFGRESDDSTKEPGYLG